MVHNRYRVRYSKRLVVRTRFELVFIPPYNLLFGRAVQTLVVCALPIPPPDYVARLSELSPTYKPLGYLSCQGEATKHTVFVVRVGFEPTCVIPSAERRDTPITPPDYFTFVSTPRFLSRQFPLYIFKCTSLLAFDVTIGVRIRIELISMCTYALSQ